MNLQDFVCILKGLDGIKTYLNLQENNPLSNDTLVLCEDDELISVTTDSVAARLSNISTSRTGGPNDVPNWVLKKFSEILQSRTKLLEKVFPIMSTFLRNKTISKTTPLRKENPFPQYQCCFPQTPRDQAFF